MKANISTISSTGNCDRAIAFGVPNDNVTADNRRSPM